MKQKRINSLKNGIQQVGLIALCVGAMFSCQEDYQLYEGGDYLQFGPENKVIYNDANSYRDTLKNLSFAYDGFDVLQDTLYFDLYAVGSPKDYDRTFVIEQEMIEGELNCEPGVHYVAFDDEKMKSEYIIKAGGVHLQVPIIFLRHESLQENKYALKIVLKANESFKLGDSSLCWRKAYVSDQLMKPSLWTGTIEKYYFGKYSMVKHRFLIDATGQNWDDEFISGIMKDMAALQYWQSMGNEAIVNYNKEHPTEPLVDEDGVLVTMP
ncbi:MAG: DUF4843 domain-containing protein [Mangrovibacterium sp.]